MTAVGFSQAASRKVYKKANNCPPPDALSTSQITTDILNSSAESPMAPSPLAVKRDYKKSTASKGLFSAMHSAQPTHVINFDENVKVRQFCIIIFAVSTTTLWMFQVDFALPQFTRKPSSSNLLSTTSSGAVKRKLVCPENGNSSKSQPITSASGSQSKESSSRDYLLKVNFDKLSWTLVINFVNFRWSTLWILTNTEITSNLWKTTTWTATTKFLLKLCSQYFKTIATNWSCTKVIFFNYVHV